jgi:hypothetical protein
MNVGETIPNDPLSSIRARLVELILDGKGGSSGGGPEGLTSRHVNYVLPGESIGEGGTFFILDCDYSRTGLLVSMGHYSDLDTVPNDPRALESQLINVSGMEPPIPERAKEENAPLVLVNFFDFDDDTIEGVDEIHAIDTTATNEELLKLIQVMDNPDLKPLFLTDEHDEKYNWTPLHQMKRRIAATYSAFLRVAGDNPAAVRHANRNYLGIHEETSGEIPSNNTRKERALAFIRRWFAGKQSD